MKRLFSLSLLLFGISLFYGCKKDKSVTLPVLSTTPITNITTVTATSGGDITSDGNGAIIARGVCWSTSVNPTTTDSKTADGDGIGQFGSNITGLTAGTIYYVRAYATNSAGTAYGDDVTFTTISQIATLTTTSVTSITSTTAVSGGNITSEGIAAVTARGVCWSTTANPTTTDSKTVDGDGIGQFVSNLTGLTDGTIYHVRAYATNSAGTAYGNEISFTATSTPQSNEVSIKGMAFIPQSLTVALNTTVKWTNNDGTAHTVTSDEGTFDSGSISDGGTFSFKFTSTGTFYYHCSIHSTMTGNIIVQ
jgi:plastocyanin